MSRTNWIDSEDEEMKPIVGRVVLAYCPEWNHSGYQICHWDGDEFKYEDQPNDDFNAYVKAWALFMEAV